MMASQSPRLDFETLIVAAPGRRQNQIAVAVVGASVATLVLLAPFARVPLMRIDAFIPAYEAALTVTDFLTAALLFAQFFRARSLALLVLACGYLFDALIIIPHALTFPGVFAPQGLLNAGPQTTSWLYCFWHGGFALFIVVYAVVVHWTGPGAPITIKSGRASLAVGVFGTGALVAALTALATAGHDYLTPIMDGFDYSMLVTKGISPSIAVMSGVAIALLWPLRRASTLNLWLLVVMCAWTCDVILSAVIGSSRFDLGWYSGRSFGLVASSLLLVALLLELDELYSRLARTELHRTTALFEAVIKMTPDLVFVKDLQSRALLRNPAALFGKTWEEVAEQKEEDWHHNPQEVQQVVANDRMVIDAGTSMQFVEKFTTPVGVRTLLSTKSPLFDENGAIVGTIGVSTDITERENRARQIEFIMRELSHRSKNLLAIIQSVARQSIRQSASLDQFEQQFNQRLSSLARLHDLLIQEEWRGASLRAIAQTQVGPFAGSRLQMSGPQVLIKPDIAQVISMIFHELATNASKYGALSNSTGTSQVSWGFIGEKHNRLFIRWEEAGGPKVTPPLRKGFGTLVLDRMALQIADASASLQYLATGFVWYLEAPLDAFVDDRIASLGPTELPPHPFQ